MERPPVAENDPRPQGCNAVATLASHHAGMATLQPLPGNRLDVTLHRRQPEAGWTAEVRAQPGQPAQRFASLQELIDWLVRLNGGAPARGLR